MNHPSHPFRNSMSSDFLTFGNQGIELNRALERRANERARDYLDATDSRLAVGRPLLTMRSLIGAALIAVGGTIAGAAPSAEPEATGHGAA